jgi:hypothetical protein
MNIATDTDRYLAEGHRQYHLNWLAVFILILLVGAGCIVAFLILLRPSMPKQITRLASNVTFPIYYPHNLPPGYSLDASTVSSTNNAALFSVINTTTGSRIVVSEQPKPSDIDFNSFYHDEYRRYESLTTPAGDGVIGDAGDSYLANITGDKTWIIVKGPQSSGDSIKSLSLTLRPIKL